MSTTNAWVSKYQEYSHADLLRRVTDLEAQLRSLNSNGLRQASSSPKPKKLKKAPKPFDPSRYHTRLIALKFAYLGGNYNGFEHHANNTTPLPTVEEELWRALRKTKLIFPEFAGKSEDEVCWDGCEYSKCGRTDRGVSAFGQVIGIKVRSARPKTAPKPADANGVDGTSDEAMGAEDYGVEDGVANRTVEERQSPQWDSIRDELSYIQTLNRVLPRDIRILAWCPHPPPDFSARFSCKERRYRYFFTNPSFATSPALASTGRAAAGAGGGWLDVEAMQFAAKKLEGLHDFRNMCKVDPSKQLSSFERRIFHAGIHTVDSPTVAHIPNNNGSNQLSKPELYYFEVRGSAFLWHQVRHMVGILFLVGQGYENPDVVDRLLDIEKSPGKPVYDMADDQPLVLWDCIFPDPASVPAWDGKVDDTIASNGYDDAIEWVYVGDEVGGRETNKRVVLGIDDGLFGRNGVMDDLWSLWRKRKMDEVLAGSLMDIAASLGQRMSTSKLIPNRHLVEDADRSDRIFDGSDRPRTVGKYVPLMKREKLETPVVVNARYAVRKGLAPREGHVNGGADVDD
ncbi:pseudouridine synthase deg1 [Recurvomyces mirabilis]|uniref:Pseudouridine synthase deg1 n=1 Tax=Recurvomyces mirabilis TaxID=574656 RepID=A0AAE1BZH0_9PEZI|nr:pseudouridine synthase deg1 [Recurvomyces mirabilis]KAK5153120.1 pseudouridine synthase deg1 [Recurvomyces mirabilis]